MWVANTRVRRSMISRMNSFDKLKGCFDLIYTWTKGKDDIIVGREGDACWRITWMDLKYDHYVNTLFFIGNTCWSCCIGVPTREIVMGEVF